MSNVVPLRDGVKLLICGCSNDRFYLHCSPSEKLTLVCTACLCGINGYDVTKKNYVDGCPCTNNCCEHPKVNHAESYSECVNCWTGCHCNS